MQLHPDRALLRIGLALFAQCLVTGVLAVSGTAKLRDLPGFGATLRRLAPIPASATRTLACLTVLLELATAALVWWPSQRIGLGVAALVFVCLALVAFRAAGLPTAVPCRCFGRAASALGRPHGYRNLVLAGIAIGGGIAVGGRGDPLSPGVLALVAAVAVIGVILTVFFDDLADLARS